MIVQPTSTNPRGRARRAAWVIRLATPVILLLVVIGSGLLGPKADVVVPDASQFALAASPLPSASIVADTQPAGPDPGFPAVSGHLAVLSVPEALTELAAGSNRPIAVAGFLGQTATADACVAAKGDARGLLGPFCERRARLVVTSGTVGRDAHLHVRIPPGVRLPPAVESADDTIPVGVVIIGHGSGANVPCGPTERGCGERFTADRVTWAGGDPFDPGPVLDTGLELLPSTVAYRNLGRAEALVAGLSGTILIASLVRPATIAAIDPDAALAMAAAPAATGLVWYVRSLETAYGPGRIPPGDVPPRVSWAILDDTTRRTLAFGVREQDDVFPASAARG